MKKGKSVLLLLTVTMLLLSACAPSKTDSAKENEIAGKTTKTETVVKIDPFRLPEQVEVTTIKSVSPNERIPQGDTIEDNLYTRYFTEQTNVKFKYMWYASGDDYTQKLKLAVASNDLPDAMVVDERTFLELADADQLENLTDVFQKYASDQVKQTYDMNNGLSLAKATIDGKLLAIPNIVPKGDSFQEIWVRQDWLDKLGLQPPKTIADVEKIAEAFINQDPDGNGKKDTIGLPGNNQMVTTDYGWNYDFKALFNAFNAYPSIWLKDNSGNVVYGSTTPEAKQALGKLAEWYKKGIIDKDFALRKNPDELVVGGQSGIFFGPWYMPFGTLTNAMMSNPDAKWAAYAIADDKGQYNATVVPPSSSFLVVKKGFKHPEALVTYFNYNTRFLQTPTPDDKKLDQTYVSLRPMDLNIGDPDAVLKKHEMIKGAIEGKLTADQLSQEMQGHLERWNKYKADPKANIGEWGPPFSYLVGGQPMEDVKFNEVYSLYTATTKTMEKRWSNLQKLETETYFKIVLGELPLDAFDQFVAEWKAQGGEQIMKEIQEAVK
ncbi:hypothetical protein J23TS9_30450 [Paenibacillus sp. J23TS9]|uniref:extracellular solute-binding protein n=1 Tax=Paenibacillus sp. J23TS9 TaxID=2807193 RepID=UPI001B1B9E20|nr:extracellular solute-binding protein [Paenibacillus sp. J23TS9]GIP27915.1 hypothetical protein J23TS9_30450 [Paenibacillus sp. J23TS9]